MLKPSGNKILVRQVEDGQDVTKSGIVIQKVDGTGSKVVRAVIVGVGEGKLLENGLLYAINFEVGDVVWIPKYAITDITVDEINYKVLSATDVIAKEVPDAKV